MRGHSTEIRALLGALLVGLAAATAAAGPAEDGAAKTEAPAAGTAKPRAVFDIEYASESAEEGIVSGSGRIRIASGDFELRVEDGGVVLWVDWERWKEFREKRFRTDGAAPAKNVLGEVIRELYAEGGVYLRRDETEIRAERLFFDFAGNRALVFDAELVTELGDPASGPRIPLVVRAERLYQVVEDELHAHSGRVTTCKWGDPHVELRVDHVRLRRQDGGDVTYRSEGNVLRAGGVPVFWFPVSLGSMSSGMDPIRDVHLGNSSRFGPYLGVQLGGGIRFGEGAEPVGDWEVDAIWRSERGMGLGGVVDYGREDLEGRIVAFYQRDREDRDHISGDPIPREDRGRARWQHRQVLADDLLGGRLTGIGEVSWLSDRGFLPEYYPREAREGKAQETVAYLDWKRGRHGLSLTGRWQLREFQTVTEYRPRLDYDLVDAPLVPDLLGIGDLLISGEAEVTDLVRRYDDRSGLRGTSTVRTGARGALHLPFRLGVFVVDPELGGGATSWSGEQEETRTDLTAAVRVSTDLWRVWPDASSEILDVSGLRHVVSLQGAWLDRFAVSTASDDLVVQDPEDQLDELRAFELTLGNRLETKRAGAVVDLLELTLRGVWFPERMEARPPPFDFREEWGLGMTSLLLPREEKWRTIDRHGMGPVTADLRAQIRRDLALLADAWYEFETRRFETWSAALRYEAYPDLAFHLGHRAIRGDSSIVTGSVDFRISDRWNAQVIHQTELRDDGALLTGLTLRRRYHDFLLGFEFRHNVHERETSVGISIEPAFLLEAERRPERTSVVDWAAPRWYR